ncbi:MAG: diguanylate cyclase, partial [Helicobacteraceae bacterium]|nr:diguanylate cyclase [Helicobacteraceae bacterium]
MNQNRSVILAFFTAFVSVLLTSYYYLHQREYSLQYKTVINAFHTMQNDYDTLSYDILKSAVYSYNNQDDIAKGMASLNLDYANLYNAPLFQNKQYLMLDYPLIDLGISIAEYNSAIEDYLMLNAGIKNSFVFLLNYAESTHEIFPSNASIHNDINAITSELSNMQRLLDKMHIQTVAEHLKNVKDFHTTNKDQRAFIQTLTLHINYIQHNFPAFIAAISTLQDKKLIRELLEIQNNFDQIAKKDFIMIDRLAILLFILIITALVVVVNLLLRSQHENIRLKDLQKRLEHIVNFDSLTALLNRNSFNHILATKQYKKPTLLLININKFKHVNDLYGADVGNYILQEMSQLIKLPVVEPYNPQYFHFGGDDFGILLEDIPAKKATRCAETLIQSVKHFVFVDNDIDINITINIAINSEEPLLENADMVLKNYKKNTLKTVVTFSKALRLKEQIQNNI